MKLKEKRGGMGVDRDEICSWWEWEVQVIHPDGFNFLSEVGSKVFCQG